MRSKTILALVLLNIVLLASLCLGDIFNRRAVAEVGGIRPSEYLMISGEVQGGTSGVIFMVDTRNALLSARTFNGKRMDDMPPIDLNRIFKAVR